MPDILLVEDKESLRRVLRLTLENSGYSVTEAADARAAVREIERLPHRMVLTDLRMPNGSGLDVLRASKEADADVPVIVMTAYGSVDEAVQAMKDGAHDFLQKPVDSNHLLLLVERALEQARLRTENLLLREEWSKRYGFPRIIGESDAIKRAVGETQRVAQTEATVLLLGESGTGKELFARAVHHLSNRRDKPFVAINCAAIPETLIENELFGHERGAFTGASDRRLGKFELAAGGTVFLDEIGELPLAVQGKLLRAIEEKAVDRIGGKAPVPVDVRIVAATNKDLRAAVDKGEFRGDLFFRLAVFPIEIPPLRERGEDVVLLARSFAAGRPFGRSQDRPLGTGSIRLHFHFKEGVMLRALAECLRQTRLVNWNVLQVAATRPGTISHRFAAGSAVQFQERLPSRRYGLMSCQTTFSPKPSLPACPAPVQRQTSRPKRD